MKTSIKIATALIFLSTLCGAQDRAVVVTNSFTHEREDRGPANVHVAVSVEGHTVLLSCNSDRIDCYMPESEEHGNMGRAGKGVYQGSNLIVHWREAKRYAVYVLMKSF